MRLHEITNVRVRWTRNNSPSFVILSSNVRVRWTQIKLLVIVVLNF